MAVVVEVVVEVVEKEGVMLWAKQKKKRGWIQKKRGFPFSHCGVCLLFACVCCLTKNFKLQMN